MPVGDFEPAVWSITKVGTDYLISDGRNKYSVPSTLIGEKEDIRVTSQIVEVLFYGSRVAAHRRFQTRQHGSIIKPEHLIPQHRKYLNYNAEHFAEWAESVGTMTAKVVRCFLTLGKAPEQVYEDRQLDKYQMLRFSTCQCIDDGHHIILKGPSGNGKTYIGRTPQPPSPCPATAAKEKSAEKCKAFYGKYLKTFALHKLPLRMKAGMSRTFPIFLHFSKSAKVVFG